MEVSLVIAYTLGISTFTYELGNPYLNTLFAITEWNKDY
jgi:hypothetical protein